MATSDLYDQYEQWKNWDQTSFYKVDPAETGYLERELGTGSLVGKNVLELGFGNATKLAWLAARGATVYGTEVNESLVQRARAAGIQVLPTDFEHLAEHFSGRFEIVIAYDVFEHLTIDEVRHALATVSRILRPQGLLVARFPNGRSPLGRTHQYADHTHRSVLSDTIVEHLIRDLSMTLERKSDGYYPPHPTSARGLLAGSKYLVRKAVSRTIQSLYNVDAPIGPNIVLHVRKA